MQTSKTQKRSAKKSREKKQSEAKSTLNYRRIREMSSALGELTNLLACIDMPIVMVGPDGTIRRFTPKARAVLKLKPTDVGRTIKDIDLDLELVDLQKIVDDVIRSGCPAEIDTVNKKGFAYRIKVHPYKASNHLLDGAVIALIDIDNLHRHINDLKIASDDASTIISRIPLPLIVLDQNRNVKFANQSFYETFQVERQEVENRPIVKLGNGQWNVPELIQLVDSALDHGKEFHGFEITHKFPEVGQRTIIINGRQVRLRGSRLNAVLLLALEDFTERNLYEQKIKDSEETFRNLISSAHDGIMIIRQDGSIEFANRQLEKIFGYKRKELINKNYSTLIDDPDQNVHSTQYANYMKSPKKTVVRAGLDLNGKRKNGALFPIDVSLSPFKSGRGTLVSCVIRDITGQKKIDSDRKILFAQQKSLQEEAIKHNQQKDEFLATLSHELRTPLTTILGWTQQLLSMKLTPEIKEALDIVERSAITQGQLIDDLLDVSRIQSGKIELDFKVLNLGAVIEEAISAASLLANNKQIKINAELKNKTCHVKADARRLQQIFWNLLTNAIKFTPNHGRIDIKLKIINSAKSKTAQVSITDSGMGIKREFLSHIFERFRQGDSSMTRVYGGLGLGLAIVKSLIDMHKGRIEATSKGPGKGSTFLVSLPIAPKQMATKKSLKNLPNTPSRLDGLKILVVDDNIDNLYLFEIMLKSLGTEVKTADSVQSCLKILEKYKPDVLLSDISMPGEDGYSLIRNLKTKQDRDSHRMLIIALTAYAGPEDIKMVAAAGFDGHISKPVNKAELSKTILRLMKE